MYFFNTRQILEEVVAEELNLSGQPVAVEFIQRNHTDVYRVRAGKETFIAHATRSGKAYLKRVRENLQRLEVLDDLRIPRVAAWRSAPSGALPGRDWALLVYRELPGLQLSRRNYDPSVWAELSDLLERVHMMEGESTPAGGPVLQGDRPSDFHAFGQALLLRIGDLPVRRKRVQQHIDEMAGYLDHHAASFRVPPRLIHADLDRSNIVVHDGRIGVLDWASMDSGDYAFDLAMLKFMLDSVAPRHSTELVRQRARQYRARFQDDTLEIRLRFFVPLAGLIHAYWCGDDTGSFAAGRAWRVRISYLHSEAQWRSPLRLDGQAAGAPSVRTEQWALDLGQPLRGLFYVMAPKRVA